MAMDVFFDFCILSTLLVLSKIVRMAFPVFQRCYIPTAVIAGFIGLLMQFFRGGYLAKISPLIQAF